MTIEDILISERFETWHSEDEDVFHVCKNCTTGDNIHQENRQEGPGDKTICKECKDLMHKEDCNGDPKGTTEI